MLVHEAWLHLVRDGWPSAQHATAIVKAPLKRLTNRVSSEQNTNNAFNWMLTSLINAAAPETVLNYWNWKTLELEILDTDRFWRLEITKLSQSMQ
jgi:hypothetical protein